MPDVGQGDVYVRFRLGEQKFKSKVCPPPVRSSLPLSCLSTLMQPKHTQYKVQRSSIEDLIDYNN